MLDARRAADRPGPGERREDQRRARRHRGAASGACWREARAQAARLIAEARDAATAPAASRKRSDAHRRRRTDHGHGAGGGGSRITPACSAELRREVGRLVVQTTATVIGKVLTPDDQRRLAEETARLASPQDRRAG